MRFFLVGLVACVVIFSYIEQSITGFIVASVIMVLDIVVKPDGKRINYFLQYVILIAVCFFVFVFAEAFIERIDFNLFSNN